MDEQAETRLQEQINDVHRLLAKHRLLETVARRQETPKSALLDARDRSWMEQSRALARMFLL